MNFFYFYTYFSHFCCKNIKYVKQTNDIKYIYKPANSKFKTNKRKISWALVTKSGCKISWILGTLQFGQHFLMTLKCFFMFLNLFLMIIHLCYLIGFQFFQLFYLLQIVTKRKLKIDCYLLFSKKKKHRMLISYQHKNW